MAKSNQEKQNLALYNAVRAVPKEAQKQFNNGSFSGTDINPMWRIRTLTEQFGMAGIGWYYDVVEHWTENLNNEIAVNVRIKLYVRDPETGEWSKPIEGVGGSKSIQVFKNGPKISDEGYKMALTDAISVACKALGIGADVYWDKDPTKYSAFESQAQQKAQQQTPPQQQPPVQQSAQSQQPGPSTMTKEQVIADINSSRNTDELNMKWNYYAAGWGKDADVVRAVSVHPCNPFNKK